MERHTERVIGGMTVHIYGLDRFKDNDLDIDELYVLYLAHQRLGSYKRTEEIALSMLDQIPRDSKPIIAVTFDQRNHGSRLVDAMRNNSWAEGNTTHAQDMMSVIDASVHDFETVIEYLPMYIPVRAQKHKNIMMGVSLGGHLAWRMATSAKQLYGLISVIGSPYMKPLLYSRLGKEVYHDKTEEEFGQITLHRQLPEDIWPASLSKKLSQGDDLVRNLPGNPKIGIAVGKQDELVPAVYVHRWLEDNRWRTHPSHNEPKLLVDGVAGHECTDKMVEFASELVVGWMNEDDRSKASKPSKLA